MAQTLVIAINPSDGTTSYQKIRYERAPDSAGSPGAFVEISNIAIDSKNETTAYTDNGGDTTSWYRYRYADTAGTSFSSYSDSTQAGQHIVTEWLKKDLPDAEVTNDDWVRWRDQVLLDFQAQRLMREIPDPISFTPSTNKDEWKDLTGEMREVVRVEIYDSSGYYITSTPGWHKWGRKIRVVDPDTTKTYKIYGLGNIRNLGDLDDDYFTTLQYGIKVRYLERKIHDRERFKYFLSADSGREVSTADLRSLRADASAEYEKRLMLHHQSWSIPARQP